LGTKHKRDKKPLVFIGVLILHGSAVLLLLRATHQFHSPINGEVEPLIFLLLHKNETIATTAPPSAAAAPIATSPKRGRLAASVPQSNAITLPPEAAAPKIDWDREAEWAARNELANTAKERDYRNLGGLSAAQLKFVRDNHLVPMAPGMVWAQPRVEVDKETLLPIIHINDHCVLILLFPFCGIGHIHPNSHLLDHLHDPVEP
jgi:hypothetical protein